MAVNIAIRLIDINAIVKMNQPFLTDLKLEELGHNAKSKIKQTPAVTMKILKKALKDHEMRTEWDYRIVFGRLKFL